MRRLFGWARAPIAGALRLVPANDVAGEGAGLRSTGSDPYFLLQPERGSLPQGRCEFVFEALPGTIPLQPVLYLDTGAGFNEAQTIRLAGGEAGTYRQLVTLSPGLARLRFDPATLSGPMPLQHVRLVPRPAPAAASPPADDYARWLQDYATLTDADRHDIRRHIRSLASKPRFAVWVAPGPGAFGLTSASLHQQLYPLWRGRPPAGHSLPRRRRWRPGAPGEVVLLLRSGDVLAPHALYCLAVALAAHPAAAVLTLDEDRLDPGTGARHSPRLRAAWSPELMRGGDAPGPLLVRAAALAAVGGLGDAPGAVHDALLRLAASLPRGAIRHVPGVLVSRSGPPEASLPEVLEADLQRRAIAGCVTGGRVLRVHYRLPDPAPLVSIIIPTRDRVALLRRTVDGVMQRTDYPRWELIVVDNGSEEPATLAYLAELAADPRVRVLPAPGPFNYSHANNLAVAAARGEVVALLNNDMDVIEPGWLREMVSHAIRPEVGAVGCKLLYADGTVQHAGIVTGMTGLAGHPFRRQPGGSGGCWELLNCARNVSAVTGACLVMRRALYQEVGGLDADALAVSYSDVDLGLKLEQAGYWVVWTPFACLYHLESATRGADSRPENAARAQGEHDALLRRWGARLLHDPYHSPCLAIDDEGYGLAWPPRLPAPWRE